MAFKLPLFSQNKKETAAQGNDANNAAPTEGSAYAEASAAPNTITRANINPNATYIGDVLQKSGDITFCLLYTSPSPRD